MKYLLISFIVSLICSIIILRIKSKKMIDETKGVQKFHSWQAPRVGGIAIYAGQIIGAISLLIGGKDFAGKFLMVILSSFPLFLSGLLEDITKNISPRLRLISALISGLVAVILLDGNLRRIDIPVIDNILENSFILSSIFTAFALSGVANAINIIDGFNGLASGVAIIVFLSYSYISFILNDFFLLYLNLTMVASILGFLLLNYPFGLIFLGDSGAYTIGFIAGLSGVMIVNSHREVSAWFPLMLLFYPIWETLFSIWRRKFMRNKSPFEPDRLHLHTLIYKRVVKKVFYFLDNKLKNSLTSPFLWFMELICSTLGILFWNDTITLIFSSTAFALFYTWLYLRIIRFKTPIISDSGLKRLKRA